jgi:ankyrin repeat protein
MEGEIFTYVKEGQLKEVKRISETLLHSKNEKGRSLVFIASMEGHKSILSYLISKKVNIHTKNKVGNTPLSVAVVKNNPDCVSLLINNGANPNTMFRNVEGGATIPLYNFAVIHKLTECVKILRRTPDINLRLKDSVGVSGYDMDLFDKNPESEFARGILKRLTKKEIGGSE